MALDPSLIPLTPATHLGDAELLAVALDRSLMTAALLLSRFGGVAGVARAPLAELESARVSRRTARQLHAALELGRRSLTPPLARTLSLVNAELVARYMQPRLALREQEEMHVLGLDVRQRLLVEFVAAVGNVAEVCVDPRDVFRTLVRENASAAVVVHNHPSGDATPSDSDRALTRDLAAAGGIVGVPLVDHVIVARDGTYSFAAHGEIE
jgi:DNA repair protein RadC